MLGFEPLGALPIGGLPSENIIQRIISRCYLLGSRILYFMLMGETITNVSLQGSYVNATLFAEIDNTNINLSGSVDRYVNFLGDTNC